MTDAKLHFDTLSVKLNEKDIEAVEMKFEGYNYKEIAEKLEVAHDTVKSWFKKGGRLAEYYQIYAEDQAIIRRGEANDTFKAHLGNAVRTLVAVMNKSKLDIAKIQAAKEIINRQMGEPLKAFGLVDENKVNEIYEAALKLDENLQSNDQARAGDGSAES